MKWYEVIPKDQRHNNWILYREVDDQPITLRERYRDRACVSCGKFDEWAALRSGIDDDVRIMAKSDVVGTDEDMLCVSQRAREILESYRVQGIDFLPLPGKHYYVAIPQFFVEVDVQKSGMRFFEQCMICGRFKEATGGPGLDALGVQDSPMKALLREHAKAPTYTVSLRIPDDPMQAFEPRVISESTFGRRSSLHISDALRKIFLDEKLSGATFFEIG